jgi:hypothetical protein
MDLSLVPIEELLAEIDKRYETLLLLTHSGRISGDTFDWHVQGNRLTMLGLMELARKHIIKDFEADETGEFFKD